MSRRYLLKLDPDEPAPVLAEPLELGNLHAQGIQEVCERIRQRNERCRGKFDGLCPLNLVDDPLVRLLAC